MKAIDFHAHIYPDSIASKATENICDYYGLKSDLSGTAETLLRKGSEAGIERYVLLPVALKPDNVRKINSFILTECEAHDVFTGFASLHAAQDDIEEETEFILLNGFKGIKLHPDTQGFATDDERMFDVYRRIQGRLPLLVHCGDRRSDLSHPKRLRRVIDLFPDLTVIAAHLGGWSMPETALAYLKDTNCYFDISSCLGVMKAEEVTGYIRAYGAERILFGTDFPVWDPVSERKRFDELPLDKEEKEMILYRNAEKLLGINGQ